MVRDQTNPIQNQLFSYPPQEYEYGEPGPTDNNEFSCFYAVPVNEQHSANPNFYSPGMDIQQKPKQRSGKEMNSQQLDYMSRQYAQKAQEAKKRENYEQYMLSRLANEFPIDLIDKFLKMNLTDTQYQGQQQQATDVTSMNCKQNIPQTTAMYMENWNYQTAERRASPQKADYFVSY